jgi:hypothetical protein
MLLDFLPPIGHDRNEISLRTQLHEMGFADLNPLNHSSEWIPLLRKLLRRSFDLTLDTYAQNVLSMISDLTKSHQSSFGIVPKAGQERFLVIGQGTGTVFTFDFCSKTLRSCDSSLLQNLTNLSQRIKVFDLPRTSQEIKAFSKEELRVIGAHIKMGLGAIMLELMHMAYQEAHTYSLLRQQGGRKIIDWPEHRRVLLELKNCVEQMEQSQIKSFTLVRDQLPVFCSQAIELLGGMGYMLESRVAQIFEQAHILFALSKDWEAIDV